jgi:hypothetical protein
MTRNLSTGLPRGWRPALLAGVLVLAIPGLAWPGATVETGAVGDAQVKAAFLFNFTRFIEWPAPTDRPLVIGVAGDVAFADVVSRTVSGRSVNGRAFQTRRLEIGDDPSSCHVVFIGVMQPHDTAELMRRVRGPVLTVGDTVQFLRDGGIVRFYVEHGRVRFEISHKNAEAAGLKISSSLLRLAGA